MITKLVEEKEGEIIFGDDDDENIFSEITVECKNGHIFDTSGNIILSGKWCELCEKEEIKKEIDTKAKNVLLALEELGLAYKRDVEIDGEVFEFLSGRRLIFEKKMKKGGSREEIALFSGYKCLIYNGEESKKEIKGSLLKRDDFIDLTCDYATCKKITLLDKDSVLKINPTAKDGILGYIRVSTAMQAKEGFSLETQESKIYRKAKALGKDVKGLYIDKGISGKRQDKREGMLRLREDIKKGDTIIFPSISRLARKTKDSLDIVEHVKKKGANLITLDADLDVTNPTGFFMFTIMAGQSQLEVEQISERTRAVLQEMKSRGVLRTKPGFGWTKSSKDGKMYEPVPDEVELIKKVLKARLKFPNLPITQFCNKLLFLGIKPKRGSKWYPKTVKSILFRHGLVKNLTISKRDKEFLDKLGKEGNSMAPVCKVKDLYK